MANTIFHRGVTVLIEQMENNTWKLISIISSTNNTEYFCYYNMNQWPKNLLPDTSCSFFIKIYVFHLSFPLRFFGMRFWLLVWFVPLGFAYCVKASELLRWSLYQVWFTFFVSLYLLSAIIVKSQVTHTSESYCNLFAEEANHIAISCANKLRYDSLVCITAVT